MAATTDAKIYPYSFYIPERDSQLHDFIESQSNLSMSMRLLMKAFIAHYESDYPDVTAMDLKELIESMGLDALDPDLKPDARRERPVPGVRKEAEKQEPKAEQVVDLNLGDSEMESDVETDMTENQDDGVVTKPEQETRQETAVESVQEPEAKSEQKPESKPEPDESDDLDDVVPDVVVEPEKPVKSNGRDAYNAAQNAAEMASDEDIMALMGGE